MESVKKLVILIVVIVAGYFIYQNFIASSNDEEYGPDVVESIPADELPEIPDACRAQAENLESAIYGAATHQSSIASKNVAYRKLRSCLNEAGFSDAEIDGTVAQIETKIHGRLKQDGEI
jgi:hypothetical protein